MGFVFILVYFQNYLQTSPPLIRTPVVFSVQSSFQHQLQSSKQSAQLFRDLQESNLVVLSKISSRKFSSIRFCCDAGILSYMARISEIKKFSLGNFGNLSLHPVPIFPEFWVEWKSVHNSNEKCRRTKSFVGGATTTKVLHVRYT